MFLRNFALPPATVGQAFSLFLEFEVEARSREPSIFAFVESVEAGGTMRDVLFNFVQWRGEPWRAGANVEHSADLLLPAATPNTPPQPVPDLTFVGAYSTVMLPQGFEATVGVRNLSNVRLSEKSPLYTYAEAPRTWYLALRGRW